MHLQVVSALASQMSLAALVTDVVLALMDSVQLDVKVSTFSVYIIYQECKKLQFSISAIINSGKH